MLNSYAARRGCLFAAVLSSALALSPVGATTPDHSWLGIKRLAIITDVQPNGRSSSLTSNFCARIKRIAERNAPVPVNCAEFGDERLRASDTVVLIAQASVQEIGGERLLLFTARKDKEGGRDPQPVLLGAAPRAVPLTGSAADEAALDRALEASLGEVLSWLRSGKTEDLLPTSQRERRIGL